jgi:hypothetical protein
VVEILGGGIFGLLGFCLQNAPLTQAPRATRRTATRVISALASLGVSCWSLADGTADGGCIIQGGKGRGHEFLDGVSVTYCTVLSEGVSAGGKCRLTISRLHNEIAALFAPNRK